MSRAHENWLFAGVIFIAIMLTGRPASIMYSERIDISVDLIGLAVSIMGLIIRVLSRDWKLTHGNDKLVTTGPYSILRNPMYFGSFLAGFGVCLILGSFVFLAIFTVVFLAVHILIARREEHYLLTCWPEEYPLYMASVPGWFPSFTNLYKYLFSSQQRITSIPIAVIKERSAVCGVLVCACMAEVVADVIAMGWAKVHMEVILWFGVASLLILMWIIGTRISRLPSFDRYHTL